VRTYDVATKIPNGCVAWSPASANTTSSIFGLAVIFLAAHKTATLRYDRVPATPGSMPHIFYVNFHCFNKFAAKLQLFADICKYHVHFVAICGYLSK
jgi:hypothetical protein